jgi:death on curing protein
MVDPPLFLTAEEVLSLHRLQLDRFGGMPGVRDMGLLESALAQPEAGFGGEYLHVDEFEMAAAYLFHLVMNHPFVDGNKRVGLHAALTFLTLNGWDVRVPADDLYDLVIAVTAGSADKAAIAEAFRANSVRAE